MSKINRILIKIHSKKTKIFSDILWRLVEPNKPRISGVGQ